MPTTDQFIIEARLQHDKEFLEKCILILYEKQNEDEKAAHDSTEQNGVGFNKSDAATLSCIAQMLKDKVDPGEMFNIKAIGKRMVKYAAQLRRYLSEDEIAG